jgi:two-component system OmpR family response regulator
MVEDEVRLAETVRRGLVAEGFVVDLVHDAAEGLEHARSRDYDVLILDIMLPSLNGYDVCRGLREAGVWTPVLMLTAKDGAYDQVDAFDLGADDYLTKPSSFVVLVARLRALVRRGAPERPTVLRVGDLTLDPATRLVRRGETDIELTPREFGLLHFLMRRPEDVVSKLEILQAHQSRRSKARPIRWVWPSRRTYCAWRRSWRRRCWRCGRVRTMRAARASGRPETVCTGP